MTNAYQLVEQGRRLLAGNRPDLAVKVFREALSQEPEHAEAHALYAAALLNSGDLAQAKREAEIALGLQPGDAYTRYVMTCVLCHEGNLKKALAHVQEALQTNPEDELCHGKLVEILWRQGKTDRAVPACWEALALFPTSTTLLNLRGLLEKGMGAKAASKSTFLELLALAPEDPNGLTNLGHLHLEQGAYPEALACFKGALRVQPDLEEARLGFVEALKATNRVYGVILSIHNAWFKSSTSARVGITILVYLILVMGASTIFEIKVPPPIIAVGFWVTLLMLASVRQLSNLLLLAHPVWRWALSEGERRTSLLILAVLGFLLAAAALAFIVPPQRMETILGLLLVFFMVVLLPLGAMIRVADAQRRKKAFIVYFVLWAPLLGVISLATTYVAPLATLAALVVWLGGVMYWLRLVWRA